MCMLGWRSRLEWLEQDGAIPSPPLIFKRLNQLSPRRGNLNQRRGNLSIKESPVYKGDRWWAVAALLRACYSITWCVGVLGVTV